MDIYSHGIVAAKVVTKLDEDDIGEVHSAADEAWHWLKPSW